VLSADTGCFSRLTEILAGKACCDDFRPWQGSELPDVIDDGDAREMMLQDTLGRRLYLAEQLGVEAGEVETRLEAANPCEQSYDSSHESLPGKEVITRRT
jgi:hypothetical protein